MKPASVRESSVTPARRRIAMTLLAAARTSSVTPARAKGSR
jgi:hypothetical protein